MFIDINSLKIKVPGGNYISLGNYGGSNCLITEAKYGYHKLWGKDSGRNLAGEQSGTLLGIFPKITVQFRKLNKAELELIAGVLDNATQVVSYYDPNKKAQVEMDTYTGDWEIVNKNLVDSNRKNEGFSIAFISMKKRS